MGLVNHVYPDQETMLQEVMKIAENIANPIKLRSQSTVVSG